MLRRVVVINQPNGDQFLMQAAGGLSCREIDDIVTSANEEAGGDVDKIIDILEARKFKVFGNWTHVDLRQVDPIESDDEDEDDYVLHANHFRR